MAKAMAIRPGCRQEGVRLMGFGHRVYKNYAARPCKRLERPESELRTPEPKS